MCGRAPVGNNRAVVEYLSSRYMIEMPMRQHHSYARDAEANEMCANGARMTERYMRVVDQRFVAIDNGVARNTQRNGPVIDPVGTVRKAVAIDTAIIEGEDIRVRRENAEMR